MTQQSAQPLPRRRRERVSRNRRAHQPTPAPMENNTGIDTLAYAERALAAAETGADKILALRAGQIGIAEINFRRSRNISLLAEVVEKQLVEKVVGAEEALDSGQLIGIYKVLESSGLSANRQIESVVSQEHDASLLSLLTGGREDTDDAKVDVSGDAIVALRMLNEL